MEWKTRFYNTDLKFNITSLVLLALLIINLGLIGIPVFVMLMVSLLAHEYSHVYAARKRGYETECVTVMFFGAAAQISNSDWVTKPKDHFIIAAAGPLCSLLLTIIFAILHSLHDSFLLHWLYLINFMLFAFNVLPIYPMDGGRMLMAILLKLFRKNLALNISLVTTLILGGALSIWAASVGNIFMMIIIVLVCVWALKEIKTLKCAI